jgi:GntR family transcriptional regulator/MocR family aminotransferase
VLYVGSFSKTMLPTLRLGFVVTPPSLRAAVHSAKYVTDWHTPLFIQQALARFIAGGDFARHIRKMNRLYQVRHELIMRGLKDFAEHLQVVPSAAGLHISALARTAAVEEIDAVVERAADASVALHGLSRFAVAAPARAGLVLGFGAIASADIAEGLRRLRSCFAVPAG